MRKVVRSQSVPLPSFILHRYTGVFIAMIHSTVSVRGVT